MIQFLLVCVIVVNTSLHVLNEFIYNRFRFLLLSSFFHFSQKKKKKRKDFGSTTASPNAAHKTTKSWGGPSSALMVRFFQEQPKELSLVSFPLVKAQLNPTLIRHQTV